MLKKINCVDVYQELKKGDQTSGQIVLGELEKDYQNISQSTLHYGSSDYFVGVLGVQI